MKEHVIQWLTVGILSFWTAVGEENLYQALTALETKY